MNKPTLDRFVIQDGAKVYTDEATMYAGLRTMRPRIASEYVRGMAHTNGMESTGRP